MYRIWRELPIIDIDTIDKRLLKDGSNNDDDNRTTDSVVSRPSSPGSESVHTEEDAPSSMSRAEKYNKAIDIGREIAEVMSHEGPREFIRSLEYCKDIVKKLRDRNLPALDERPHATPNASPLDKSTSEETLHTVTMDESSDSPSNNVEFVVPNTCNNEVLLSEVKFPKRAKHTKIALCKAYPEVYKDQERLIFKQVPRGKGRPKNVRYRSKIQRKTPVVNNNLPQVTSRPVVDVWQQDSGVSLNKGPIEVLNEINPIDRPDEKCEGSSNKRSLDNNQEVFNGTDNVTLHSVVNEPNADNGLINAGEEDGWSQYEDSNNAAKFLVRNKAIYPNIIKPFQFNRPLRDLFKTVKIEDEDDVEGIDQYCFFSSSTKEMNDFINFVQNILEYKKTSFVVLTDLKAQTVIKYLYKNINRQKGREYETFPECEELETDLSKL